MPITLDNPPIADSVIETDEAVKDRRNPFYMAKGWINWLQLSLTPRVQAASQWMDTVTLTGRTASIGATAVPLPVLARGLYRVSWYVRVTTVAGVSSSIQVTLGWTEGAQALTLSGVALTGNLVTTVEAGSLLLQVDRATSLTYATTYASNPAAAMNYELIVTVEQVN